MNIEFSEIELVNGWECTTTKDKRGAEIKVYFESGKVSHIEVDGYEVWANSDICRSFYLNFGRIFEDNIITIEGFICEAEKQYDGLPVSKEDEMEDYYSNLRKEREG